MFLKLSLKPFHRVPQYGCCCGVVAIAVIGGVVITDVVVGLIGIVFVVTFDFMPKWDTCTFLGPPQCVLFLVQQLLVGTNSPGPMCKSAGYTVLCR